MLAGAVGWICEAAVMMSFPCHFEVVLCCCCIVLGQLGVFVLLSGFDRCRQQWAVCCSIYFEVCTLVCCCWVLDYETVLRFYGVFFSPEYRSLCITLFHANLAYFMRVML